MENRKSKVKGKIHTLAFVGVAPDFQGYYMLIRGTHQQTGDKTQNVVGVRTKRLIYKMRAAQHQQRRGKGKSKVKAKATGKRGGE